MAIVNVTETSFDEVIDEPGIVLLDWWAEWCGPCRAFAPIYEAAAGRHPEVTFGKIDTEREPGLAAAFAIRSIPTLMAFRDGILLMARPGMVSGAALDQLVGEIAKLDMDEVRRQISSEATETPAT
jgi:thioredoxin 1